MTIQEILLLNEKEDKVEFKEAVNTFSFEGGDKTDFRKRRKCVLGYVVALANEGGGKLIFGIREKNPQNIVVGSQFSINKEKDLEQKVYERLKIRIRTEVVFDEFEKRVLIVDIPSRPIGKVYTFEDTPLMRVGDQLDRMSDQEYIRIINEQEPDFSVTICDGLKFEDLAPIAIKNLKNAYSKKQQNPSFLTLDDKQILSDLELLIDSKLTYASLILLGTRDAIRKFLPQSAVHLEYRSKRGQITFDKRDIFQGGYFLEIDSLWKTIDNRNGFFPVQDGAYIFDIPFFNQEVIREAINNAVAHRDYKLTSEVLIKQYPNYLEVVNPGGFPKGVSIDNIITVNSTPRNRRLAEVLSKTGTVERSGQGVDKIYFQCLSEAKGEPDYSNSDDYQVELHLSGIVQDKAFALFIGKIQEEKSYDERLSVHEILILEKIRKGETDKKNINNEIASKLLSKGYIEKVGKTRSQQYRLSREYYEFVNRKGEYTANSPLGQSQIGFLVVNHLKEFKEAKMSDFIQLFKKFCTKEQVKYLVYKLTDIGFLERKGKGRSTKYIIGKEIAETQQLMSRAIKLGLAEMIKTGEMKVDKDESNSTRKAIE